MKLWVLSAILMAPCAGAQDLPQIQKVCFTQWFDRDNPSGYGDYETLTDLRTENPNKICATPLNIQAATLTGVPAENIGQAFQVYDTVSGFACVNTQQKNGECCLDYKVRFRCPCPWTPKLTLAVEEASVKTNNTST